MRPYERLATLYDKGEWGNFGLRYSKLLEILFKKYNFKPQVVFDVACGTGILVRELHKQNYQVIGVDISPEMIEVAKKNTPNAEFFVEDIQSMKLNINVDLITCAFNSLNYLLNDKQIYDAFKTINSHLKHKGYFLFDVNTPTHYSEKDSIVIDRDIDGVKFKQKLKYDAQNRIIRIIFDFGYGQSEEHIQRAYTFEEISSLLSKSHFTLLEYFQDFELNPPTDKSDRIFFFAQRNN